MVGEAAWGFLVFSNCCLKINVRMLPEKTTDFAAIVGPNLPARIPILINKEWESIILILPESTSRWSFASPLKVSGGIWVSSLLDMSNS